MRLINPYTGHAVDAPVGVAERLMASGYKPEGKPEAKPAPKRRAARKTKSDE